MTIISSNSCGGLNVAGSGGGQPVNVTVNNNESSGCGCGCGCGCTTSTTTPPVTDPTKPTTPPDPTKPKPPVKPTDVKRDDPNGCTLFDVSSHLVLPYGSGGFAFSDFDLLTAIATQAEKQNLLRTDAGEVATDIKSAKLTMKGHSYSGLSVDVLFWTVADIKKQDLIITEGTGEYTIQNTKIHAVDVTTSTVSVFGVPINLTIKCEFTDFDDSFDVDCTSGSVKLNGEVAGFTPAQSIFKHNPPTAEDPAWLAFRLCGVVVDGLAAATTAEKDAQAKLDDAGKKKKDATGSTCGKVPYHASGTGLKPECFFTSPPAAPITVVAEGLEVGTGISLIWGATGLTAGKTYTFTATYWAKQFGSGNYTFAGFGVDSTPSQTNLITLNPAQPVDPATNNSSDKSYTVSGSFTIPTGDTGFRIGPAVGGQWGAYPRDFRCWLTELYVTEA